jgi:hypothetical protein
MEKLNKISDFRLVGIGVPHDGTLEGAGLWFTFDIDIDDESFKMLETKINQVFDGKYTRLSHPISIFEGADSNHSFEDNDFNEKKRLRIINYDFTQPGFNVYDNSLDRKFLVNPASHFLNIDSKTSNENILNNSNQFIEEFNKKNIDERNAIFKNILTKIDEQCVKNTEKNLSNMKKIWKNHRDNSTYFIDDFFATI